MSTILINTAINQRLIFTNNHKNFAQILYNSLIENNITDFDINSNISMFFDLDKIQNENNENAHHNAKINPQNFYYNDNTNTNNETNETNEIIFSNIYKFINKINTQNFINNDELLSLCIPMIYLSKEIQNIIKNNLDLENTNYEFLIESEMVLDFLYSKLDNLLYLLLQPNDEYIIID